MASSSRADKLEITVAVVLVWTQATCPAVPVVPTPGLGPTNNLGSRPETRPLADTG